MKPTLTLMAALTVAILIATVTTSVQQVSAPRDCGACIAFKKLTHEFEKAVIDAATVGDPNIIPSLLEKYNQEVLDIFARGS
jgi:hypothetical protein